MSVLAVDRRAVNTQVDWSGVRERVIAVEEAERRARGREPSRCPTFEPVLTPAEIAEVEARFGVTLPDEYRTFLAEVGAGGPGPALHLTSLCRIDGTWGWLWDGGTTGCWTPAGRSSKRKAGLLSAHGSRTIPLFATALSTADSWAAASFRNLPS